MATSDRMRTIDGPASSLDRIWTVQSGIELIWSSDPDWVQKWTGKIIYLMNNEVWFLNRVVILDIVLIFHFPLVSQLSQFCLAGCFLS